MEILPGMTRYEKDAVPEKEIPHTGLSILPSFGQRPIILLGTALITEEMVFRNGLFQNVYVLYRMFESMGYTPIMFVNSKPQSIQEIPKYMRNIRIMQCEDLLRTPVPIYYYIEIGMAVDINMHRFIKQLGAKIAKLYLGNILNIDIETPVFMPMVNFAHHTFGLLDEVWVSPHYAQHAQYARALNKVDLEKKESCIAPYVWDSKVLTGDGEQVFRWKPAAKAEDDVFLILEPNISFQKCSLVPLMILEAWYRKNPDWKGKVILSNGERMLMFPFFKENIWNTLELVKKGRVEVKGRNDIVTLLRQYPSAIPLCHQWNNEYNYMILEFFECGFPVVHNASDWKKYGYYYSNSSITEGVKRIEEIRQTHAQNLEVYRAHAEALFWSHSPYNPAVQEKWKKLLEGSACSS